MADDIVNPQGMAPAPPAKTPMQAGSSFGSTPEMNSGMTFRELGSAGLRAFGGYVREEFLPALQGRQAVTMFREMLDNSPIIGGLMFSIMATMRKVEWRTVPADDTPAAQEMADFADSLRMDMSHTWEDSITEGLSMLGYGFAAQEIVYKQRLGRDPGPDPRNPGQTLPKSDFDDRRIGWRRLPLRGQDTIIKWFFSENGEVTGMTQMPWIGPIVDIPIEKMLLFRPSHHKNNPEGRSILRTAYRPYYFIKRMEEQEAIMVERFNGVPVIRIPTEVMDAAKAGDADAIAAMATFRAMSVNLRIDEQMGILLPSDTYTGPTGPTSIPLYSLELISPGSKSAGSGSGGGGSGAMEPIARHSTNILISVLADFLMLGHGKSGTQALAVTKQDMFYQAVEGYLNSQAAVYNRHGLSRVWALNGLDQDLMPEYVPDLAQRVDLDVLSNFILRLAQSGMAIFPNTTLETALMDAAGLPDIQDADLADAVGGGGDGPQAIVGPNAAPPEPPGGAALGDTPFGKIVMASLARRMKRHEGPSMPIDTNRKRRKNMPPKL